MSSEARFHQRYRSHAFGFDSSCYIIISGLLQSICPVMQPCFVFIFLSSLLVCILFVTICMVFHIMIFFTVDFISWIESIHSILFVWNHVCFCVNLNNDACAFQSNGLIYFFHTKGKCIFRFLNLYFSLKNRDVVF